MNLESSLIELEKVKKECCLDNWDGGEANAVDDEHYQRALKFLNLLPNEVSTPDISADNDGEINFEWYEDRKKTFSVSVGYKELSYAGLFEENDYSGTIIFEDEIHIKVLDFIRRL